MTIFIRRFRALKSVVAHSYRSATIGSTCAAFRAGRKNATKAVKTNTRATWRILQNRSILRRSMLAMRRVSGKRRQQSVLPTVRQCPTRFWYAQDTRDAPTTVASRPEGHWPEKTLGKPHRRAGPELGGFPLRLLASRPMPSRIDCRVGHKVRTLFGGCVFRAEAFRWRSRVLSRV